MLGIISHTSAQSVLIYSITNTLIKVLRQLGLGNSVIVCLSLLTNLNHMREMLLFVCSKMAD